VFTVWDLRKGDANILASRLILNQIQKYTKSILDYFIFKYSTISQSFFVELKNIYELMSA